MTKVRYRESPVWHETGLADGHTGRPICCAETPANLLVRLKGTRQVLRLPWTLAYLRAATLEAQAIALAKQGRRRVANVVKRSVI